jgi:hypothetical protein
MRTLTLLLATLFALTLSSAAFAEPVKAPNEPAKQDQPVGDAAKLGTKDDPKALAKKTDHKKTATLVLKKTNNTIDKARKAVKKGKDGRKPLSLAIAYQKAAVSEHKNGREVAAIRFSLKARAFARDAIKANKVELQGPDLTDEVNVDNLGVPEADAVVVDESTITVPDDKVLLNEKLPVIQ